jgi:very-short-patch-repair endonuclease
MTALEKRAWSILRSLRDDGIAVRRQHPIGKYIADFAIMRARIAIEIDGPLHEAPEHKTRDDIRDRGFSALGWRVMRFTSTQLDDELAFVAAIRAAAAPSPRGEGEGGGVKLDFAATRAAPVPESAYTSHPPAPRPPPLTGRGSALEPHLKRRTRANRKLKPRRK